MGLDLGFFGFLDFFWVLGFPSKSIQKPNLFWVRTSASRLSNFNRLTYIKFFHFFNKFQWEKIHENFFFGGAYNRINRIRRGLIGNDCRYNLLYKIYVFRKKFFQKITKMPYRILLAYDVTMTLCNVIWTI